MTASQGYSSTDDPQIETGGQTEQQTYSTALNGVYSFNDKLSMNMALNQTLNDYGQSSSANLVVASILARGQPGLVKRPDLASLKRGFGLGLGYNQQQGSSDSAFQQYQAQMSWRVTDKISFQLNGGLEDLEYLNSGASCYVSPPFSVAAFNTSLLIQPKSVLAQIAPSARGIPKSKCRIDVRYWRFQSEFVLGSLIWT